MYPVPIDMCSSYPPSQKLHSVVDRDYYRDPQLVKMQKICDCGALTLDSYIFRAPLHLRLREHCGVGVWNECKSQSPEALLLDSSPTQDTENGPMESQ